MARDEPTVLLRERGSTESGLANESLLGPKEFDESCLVPEGSVTAQ